MLLHFHYLCNLLIEEWTTSKKLRNVWIFFICWQNMDIPNFCEKSTDFSANFSEISWSSQEKSWVFKMFFKNKSIFDSFASLFDWSKRHNERANLTQKWSIIVGQNVPLAFNERTEFVQISGPFAFETSLDDRWDVFDRIAIVLLCFAFPVVIEVV